MFSAYTRSSRACVAVHFALAAVERARYACAMTRNKPKSETKSEPRAPRDKQGETAPPDEKEKPSATEVGGRDGPDPTRFGDWEKDGRCVDF
jgi:hypothetical protein